MGKRKDMRQIPIMLCGKYYSCNKAGMRYWEKGMWAGMKYGSFPLCYAENITAVTKSG